MNLLPSPRLLAFAIALATSASVALPASAQYSDELRQRNRRASSENLGLELKIGTYDPDANAGPLFGGDNGPLLQLEFDVFAYRIPYVGLIGGGVALGWARYEARLCQDPECTQRFDEKAKLKLFPIATLAVLRFDVLARQLDIPLVVTGKIGFDSIFYRSSGGTSGSGRTHGLRWAIQFALELDFLDRRRAAALDQEWGINHSTLFVEIFGSSANSSVDLGSNLAWTIGLGITF